MCNNLIMPFSDLIKNITSKDVNISQNTINKLIKSCNLEAFKKLCDNSEFIFPFLKERIIKDFVKLINENDLNSIFEFSKVYSADFEEMIVKSWLKFANEDLTDSLLELFEKGTDEQKAYCASYFSYINDSLALAELKKTAKSEFLPLKINSAKALHNFQDTEILDEMTDKILSDKTQDEFEKMSAFEFIIAYNSKNSLQFTIEHCFKSPFVSEIISNVLDFNSFQNLKKVLNDNQIIQIFWVLLENYPENIPLNTIQYYSIYDFIEYLKSLENNIQAKNLLLIAKANFSEYLKEEIYNFDLDKNTKNELKEIVNLLKDVSIEENDIINLKNIFNNINNIDDKNGKILLESSIKAVEEYKISSLANDINNFITYNIENADIPKSLIAQAICVLKNLNKTNLIDKGLIDKIEDENIKALIKSYIV